MQHFSLQSVGRFNFPACFSCGACSVYLFLGHCGCSPSRKDIWIYEAPQDMVCSSTPHISSAGDGWNPVCMSSIYTRATRWDVLKEVEWESHVAWVKLSEVKNSSELEQLSILQAKLVSRKQELSVEKQKGLFSARRWYLYINAVTEGKRRSPAEVCTSGAYQKTEIETLGSTVK